MSSGRDFERLRPLQRVVRIRTYGEECDQGGIVGRGESGQQRQQLLAFRKPLRAEKLLGLVDCDDNGGHLPRCILSHRDLAQDGTQALGRAGASVANFRA